MNSSVADIAVEAVLDRFDAVVDDVLALGLGSCTDEQVLTVWRRGRDGQAPARDR